MNYSMRSFEKRLRAVQRALEASRGGLGKVYYKSGEVKTIPVRAMLEIIKSELDSVSMFECDPRQNGQLQELLNGLIEGET